MATLVDVQDLTKRYGKKRGVEEVNFQVKEGEVFGFLGPNGAGKTTTIRSLMGLLKPSSGTALINSLDSWKNATVVKAFVGYLPGEFTFDPQLTGAQIIAYLGHLRGNLNQEYTKQLIERLEFDPSRRFREYSRGNKQKLGLIQAFMHKPKLLILDEPTSGLDPLNQQEFHRLVRDVQEDGRTILLSSHVLNEVEQSCERVAIIRDGRLIRIDEVSNLKQLRQYTVEIEFPVPAEIGWFSSIQNISDPQIKNGNKAIKFAIHGDLQEVIQVAAQHQARNFVVHEPSLEEVFLRFYSDRTTAEE